MISNSVGSICRPFLVLFYFSQKNDITLAFLFHLFYSVTSELLFCSCAVFNLGEYRRMATPLKSHHFFKQENVQAMSVRAQCALDALEDVCKWLEAGGEVGVSLRVIEPNVIY